MSRPLWWTVLPLVAAFVWAYWATFGRLGRAWINEPDYSHGVLVIPLAIWFLYLRRDDMPGFVRRPAWAGLALIVASVVMRAVGSLYFFDALDGWSMLLWLAGAIWVVGGWRMLRWSGPSVAFLFFMMPIPFRAERLLSLPLQKVATTISSTVLRCLGQPAFAEGNVIVLGQQRLEVADACCGMRIFFGVVALGFAYVIITRRALWEKTIILLMAIPISLAVNSLRIVATTMIGQHASSPMAKEITHDAAGLIMIPLAVALFALVIGYLNLLTRPIVTVGVGELYRRTKPS